MFRNCFKRVALISSFLLSLLLFAPTVKATEQITSFDSDITINQDTSLTIQETIVFETDIPKHGIYRYIPYRLREGNTLRTHEVKLVSITDAEGNSLPFEKSPSSGNVFLKIGDPNTTFTGKKTYIITYTVSYPIKRFENHDELYWDITGEGWEVPIINSSATINTPHAPITQTACYSGAIGRDDRQCQGSFTETTASFTYPKTIETNQNFTVVVGLDKNNQLVFPTSNQTIDLNLINNLAYLVALLPSLFMLALWFKKGRDFVFISDNIFNTDENQPTRKRGLFERNRTPFVYEPLTISPGEAGVMLDEKADHNDVIAELVELARQKYLSIERIEKKGLIRTSSDYVLKKLLDEDDSLTKPQAYLHEQLFMTDDEVKISKLKGTFYMHFEKTKELLEQAVKAKKLFTHTPEKSKMWGLVAAIFSIATAGVILILIINLTQNILPLGLLALGLPLNIFIGNKFVQKTALGTNLMLQAVGLKETLRLAKWRDEIKEKHLFLEEIIPFSIALGVIDKLSKDMEDLGLQPPDYMSHALVPGTSLNNFSRGFTAAAVGSMSHNPSSSSGSSGSGFSGGSSGGGGGGGGGGSW